MAETGAASMPFLPDAQPSPGPSLSGAAAPAPAPDARPPPSPPPPGAARPPPETASTPAPPPQGLPLCPSSAQGLPLCPSSALAERGDAWVWDLRHQGRPERAFALRVDGRVVAYLNRCLHVPAEMDWQPGRFLDAERAFIVCSIHGATYAPHDGRCVGGPCGRGRLVAVAVAEADGQVCWYPSPHLQPVPPGASAP